MIPEDRRAMRRLSALLLEHAAWHDREGRPGSAECVRICADADIQRLGLRCDEAERMRRDMRAIEQATTERLHQQA